MIDTLVIICYVVFSINSQSHRAKPSYVYVTTYKHISTFVFGATSMCNILVEDLDSDEE